MQRSSGSEAMTADADRGKAPIVGLEIESAPARAGGLLVSVRGEVDLATAAQLNGALRAATRQGASSVVVDLTGVSFIDCAGLRVLRELAPAGGPMRVVCEAGGAFERLLSLTGLHGCFSLHGALGDALVVGQLAA